jgi:hypothetical protein
VRFREHLQTVNVSTEWLTWSTITGSLEGGRSVDYFPPPGVEPSPASFLTGSITLSLRGSPQLRADITYLINSLRAAAPEGGAIFDQHVARTALYYQFTGPLSLRAIVDYRGVLPDSTRVSLSREKRLTGDLLVTYPVQPGTALYIGYTAALDNTAFQNDGGALAGLPDRLRSRQLFVKTSYLVRF